MRHLRLLCGALSENRKRKEFLILPDGTAQIDEPIESAVQVALESGPQVI